MNTRYIMTSSAVFLGVSGIMLSFLPQEIMEYLGAAPSSTPGIFLVQLLGALYFAFAMVNWTARGTLMGGIYGRPIALGNLIHFIMGALALGKGYSTDSLLPVQCLTAVYFVFALLFIVLFFRHPIKSTQD